MGVEKITNPDPSSAVLPPDRGHRANSTNITTGVALLCLTSAAASLYLQYMTVAYVLSASGAGFAVLNMAVSRSSNPKLLIPSKKEQFPLTQFPLTQEEQLQKEFWEAVYETDSSGKLIGLERNFRMYLYQQNVDSKTKIANIVNYYNRSKENILSDEEKQLLKKCLGHLFDKFPVQKESLQQLKQQYSQLNNPCGFAYLPDGKLIVFENTQGDGSCGPHAFRGEYIDGRYIVQNIGEVRAQFADWIQMKYKQGELPQPIEQILEECFTYWETAPPKLKTATNKKLRDNFYERYQKALTEKDREDIQKVFIQAFLEKYLGHIRDISSYLSDQELGVSAECFKKTLIIYLAYPPHSGIVTPCQPYNPGCQETVHVYYDYLSSSNDLLQENADTNRGHFMRAFIFDPDQSHLKSTKQD